MSQVKVIQKAETPLDSYFAVLNELQVVFKQARLPSSRASVLAMHLAEIDEESEHYRKLVAELRARDLKSTNGKGNDVVEQLVELQISLEHIVSHAQAVSKLLSISIDTLDTEE